MTVANGKGVRWHFIKWDSFAQCIWCRKPTCFTLNGDRTHKSCATHIGRGVPS